jgi:hypothetical protein
MPDNQSADDNQKKGGARRQHGKAMKPSRPFLPHANPSPAVSAISFHPFGVSFL